MHGWGCACNQGLQRLKTLFLLSQSSQSSQSPLVSSCLFSSPPGGDSFGKPITMRRRLVSAWSVPIGARSVHLTLLVCNQGPLIPSPFLINYDRGGRRVAAPVTMYVERREKKAKWVFSSFFQSVIQRLWLSVKVQYLSVHACGMQVANRQLVS